MNDAESETDFLIFGFKDNELKLLFTKHQLKMMLT